MQPWQVLAAITIGGEDQITRLNTRTLEEDGEAPGFLAKAENGCMCTDLYAGRAGRFQQALVIEPGMKPRMIRDADTAEVMIRGDLVALKIARHRLEGSPR